MIRTFTDIVVYPSQDVLRAPGPLFRGGPDWPRFHMQIRARHCWYALPLPVDARPTTAPPMDVLEEGIWCGPVSYHFGHFVADFGMRIAASLRIRSRAPLLFSIWSVPGAVPLPFFWEIVEHLGFDRERVRFVDRPTRVKRLHVAPQAERSYGGGPSRAHLDHMDAIVGPRREHDIATLFVSRAGQTKGKFAGEGALERAFMDAGTLVLRPETVPLRAQLDLYRRADRLVFTEGSAVHALQLLGRLDSDVIVLGRRPWRWLASASLRPRVRKLHYVHTLRGLVYGLRASGKPQTSAALSILDTDRLLARLRGLGFDLAGSWDPDAHQRACDADLADWIADRLAQAAHTGERQMIERRLRALSLPPIAHYLNSTVALSPS